MRKERGRKGKGGEREEEEEVADVLQWLIDGMAEEERGQAVDTEMLVEILLGVASMGVEKCTEMAGNCLFEIRREGREEIIEELRREAVEAWEREGKTWTVDSLKGLKKLDDFMKDCGRLRERNEFEFHRRTTASIVLPDGYILPSGYNIAFSSRSMNRDSELCEGGEKSDAYLFYRSREFCGNGSHGGEGIDEDSFTGPSENDLFGGDRKTTCPGWWYAEVQMKLLFATFLVEYEFKFEDVEEGMDEIGVYGRGERNIWIKLREGGV